MHVADVAAAVLAAGGAARLPPGTPTTSPGREPLTFAELLRIGAAAVASRTRFVPVPLAR